MIPQPMPHNEEAEQGLLGCLLIDNSCAFNVMGIVGPDDFFIPVHGEIYTAIMDRVRASEHASPITLKHVFKDHEELQDLGGAAYLADLAANMFTVVNHEHYAKVIADLADKRRLLEAMEAGCAEIRAGSDAEAVRSSIVGAMLSERRYSHVKTRGQVIDEILRDAERPKIFRSTGLPLLDSSMEGGLYPGFTYGFAGPEKGGKTTLAHTISLNLNNAGVRHAYFALEMGAKQIEQRNLAREMNINSVQFLRGAPQAMQALARKRYDMPDNVLYADMPGSSFDQIRSELFRLVMRERIEGFVLDYWQLVNGGSKGQNRSDFLFEVAQWFANFARRHKVWCIMICQLNRGGDVFGSAGLDKACDQLYFIEKPEIPDHRGETRWLSMRRTRYTSIVDIGSENQPAFIIDPMGPYFREV